MSGPDTFLLSVKNIIYQGPFEVPDWKTWHFYSSPTTSVDGPYAMGWKIFPNPAHRFVQVSGVELPAKYFWLDLNGRVIEEGTLITSRIGVPHQIHASLLYLNITTHSSQISQPVMILR